MPSFCFAGKFLTDCTQCSVYWLIYLNFLWTWDFDCQGFVPSLLFLLRSHGGFMQNDHKKELQHYKKAIWTFLFIYLFLYFLYCVCFSGALLAYTYKPFIQPVYGGYNGLLHSPNALQQRHSDNAYIYNHKWKNALYMYVNVHYHIYVYIHRYTCDRFIYVLCVYTCLHISLYLYIYIYMLFSFSCVWVWVACEWRCEIWHSVNISLGGEEILYFAVNQSACFPQNVNSWAEQFLFKQVWP